MNLSAIIDAMVKAGCSAEQLAEVVRAHEAEREAQGPRAVPSWMRVAVFERDGFRCVYCGNEGGVLQCDHVVAYSRGGRTEMENLAAACRSCNASKKDRDAKAWRQKK